MTQNIPETNHNPFYWSPTASSCPDPKMRICHIHLVKGNHVEYMWQYTVQWKESALLAPHWPMNLAESEAVVSVLSNKLYGKCNF